MPDEPKPLTSEEVARLRAYCEQPPGYMKGSMVDLTLRLLATLKEEVENESRLRAERDELRAKLEIKNAALDVAEKTLRELEARVRETLET